MSFQNTTTTTSNNTLPIQQQQQAGGHVHVQDKLHQLKNDAHMPSNQSMLNQLDKASYTLNQTQASDKGQLLGPSNQRVVQDVQNIIQDERNIITRKNEGDALQRVINDAKVLGHKLGGKVEGSDTSMLKSLINDWKHIFSSVTGGDEAKDLANTGNSLFKGLADTEEFLDLVSELINLIKLLIARADSAITKDTSKQSEHKNEWDREGEVIMEKVRLTLDTLAANDLWTHLVTQGRSFAHKTAQEVKGALPEAQAQAQQALQQAAPQGNIWEALDSREMHTFTEDLKQFLQRLVGPEHSVEPLFEYTKAALRDIKNDRELHQAIHLTEDTLHNVAVNADQAIHDAQDSTTNHAANPAYNAMTQHHTTMNAPSLEKTYEPHNVDVQQVAGETEEQLKTVANHLQAALNNIKHNQNLHRAREEAHILREAFLNDPDNRQLIADARQLWHDLHSPSGGLDPTLLIGLREAVVPMFLDHFNNVPIPPIHSTVSMLGKMAFTIEGITLSIPQILPENLYVRFEYEMDTTIRSLDVTQQRLYMHLELRDIHVHLRNVAWAYQRLSAPRKADSGHLDLDTLGDGITTKLKVQIRSDHTVDVKEAHVNVQRFTTKFTDSKHNKLYQGLSHVFAHQIKKNIQKSVEAKLKQMGAEFGGKLMTTLANVQQKSTAMLGVAMGKKAQIFEMLSNKRGQHQPKEGGGMKARAQHVRENSLFQSAVHKAASSATHALDEQQRKVDEKKAEAHERKEENARMESAAVDYLAQHQSGLAPTLPATNRPASPPVPAMTFIPDSNVSTAPITQNHGLSHVNPTAIDSRPMTDASTHSVDPEIQRVLAEKLNLTQH